MMFDLSVPCQERMLKPPESFACFSFTSGWFRTLTTLLIQSVVILSLVSKRASLVHVQ